MIEVKDLTKTYAIAGQSTKAVDGVSFTVQSGEMVSIVGHSGSGKTTLLSLMGGLTRPDYGSVVIDGVDIWQMEDDALSEFRNRKMNFVYQFSSLMPTLTALENVMLPTVFGTFDKGVEEYALELLATVGLRDKMNSYPSHLSGGQQRRVAIARAFVNRPEIVLADEPTGDLDEETEAEIMAFFEKTNREKNVTVVMVTHSTELALRAGKRLRMKHGTLEKLR